jgi:hypothetical protein
MMTRAAIRRDEGRPGRKMHARRPSAGLVATSSPRRVHVTPTHVSFVQERKSSPRFCAWSRRLLPNGAATGPVLHLDTFETEEEATEHAVFAAIHGFLVASYTADGKECLICRKREPEPETAFCQKCVGSPA